MDIVVSVAHESTHFLTNIAPCIHSSNNLYVYVSSGNGVSKSLTKHKSGSLHLEAWLSHQRDNLFVSEIANTWSGTEASAFALHIVTHYDVMLPKTVFLHAHDGSWHSDRICALVRRGEAASPTTGFLNLNRAYPLRCLSPSKVSGPEVNNQVRDFYYANWQRWTNATPPKRIVFECCAQFVASKRAIHSRSLNVWTNILRAIVHERLGNNWEYLWPTLIDEKGSAALSDCR